MESIMQIDTGLVSEKPEPRPLPSVKRGKNVNKQMSPMEWVFLIGVFRGTGIRGDESAELKHPGGAIPGGGIPSTRYRFPYIVRIYVKADSYQPLCTGSIVSPSIVLTAGHCCARLGSKIVVTGGENRNRFYKEESRTGSLNLTGYRTHRVEKEFIHPQFEQKNRIIPHDVCLLTLQRPMNASEDLQAVVPVSYGRVYTRKCTTIGHRSIGNSGRLQLHYKQVFGEATWRGFWLIRVDVHSICDGDSGGPLVCAGKLYGIASFSTANQCNDPGEDYYAYLREERDFVEHFISGGVVIFIDTLFFLTIILVTPP